MKKRLVTILVIAVLAVFGVTCFTACNTPKDSGKKLSGFDIDLANEVFKGIDGIKVETRLIEWGSKEMELNSGKIDLVWNGLTITPEREANMQISEEYLVNEQSVVVKSGNAAKYTKKADFAGKKISVEAGSAGLDVATALKAENGSINVKEAESQLMALTDVKAGQADLAIIDSTMAGYMTSSNTDFSDLKIVSISDMKVEKEYYGVAAKKGNTKLIGFINYKLQQLQQNGTYAKVLEKYGLTTRSVEIKGQTEVSVEDMLAELRAKNAKKDTIIIGYTLNAPMAIEK